MTSTEMVSLVLRLASARGSLRAALEIAQVFKMTNFALQRMNFALKMMDISFKMMYSVF